MRDYYVLFSCDEWKSYSSMKLIGIFNKNELVKVIKRRIKKRELHFNRDIKEISKMSVEEIKVALEFGYIESLKLNQEI